MSFFPRNLFHSREKTQREGKDRSLKRGGHVTRGERFIRDLQLSLIKHPIATESCTACTFDPSRQSVGARERERKGEGVVSIKSIDQVLQITAEHGRNSNNNNNNRSSDESSSRDRSRLTLAPRGEGRGAGAGWRRVKSREDKSRLIQNAYREKSRARIYRSVAIPASCAVPVPPSRFARARLVTSRYTGKSGM